MLDLDHMAAARARSLNQNDNEWREAVWSCEFQKLSSHMSDSEIEILISYCASAANLRQVAMHLNSLSLSEGSSPFCILNTEAKKVGLKPEIWVKTLGEK